MAKAGFWMQGAKGKLANAVFFKGQNGTVQRQNVTPSNPRTQAQLYNRIIFQTVTAAKNALLPLINISFEGMSKREAQQYFTKVNMAKIKGEVAFDVKSGTTFENSHVSLLPKNFYILAPNRLTVAKGSIENTTGLIVENNGKITRPEVVVGEIGDAVSGSKSKILQQILGIAPNSQLTFLVVHRDVNNILYTGIQTFLYNTNHEITRVVFKNNVDDHDFNINEASFKTDLKNLLIDCIDLDKSSNNAVEIIIGLVDGGEVATANDKLSFSLEYEIDEFAAGSIIYSKQENDVWHIADASMVILDSARPSLYYKDALASWAPNGIPTDDGNFLEQGGSDNEL